MTLKYKSLITKENVENFMMRKIDEIVYNADHVYVKFESDGIGRAAEYLIDDYSFKGINSYKSIDCSTQWQNEMLKNMEKEQAKKYMEEVNAYVESQKIEL